MKYMGSKNRIVNNFIPIFQKQLTGENWFIDLFCGGGNVICNLDYAKKTGNDINPYVIALLRALRDGWTPPFWVSREKYYHVKDNPESYDPAYVGYCCFQVSYSGKPFSGYAGSVNTKSGIRNYQEEARENLLRQSSKLKGTTFHNRDFKDFEIPSKSLVYCDPPYKGTTGYRLKFDHDAFYDFIRNEMRRSIFLISEYAMPDDFVSIWEGTLRSSLSANGLYGGSKTTIEKLFVHKSQTGYFND